MGNYCIGPRDKNKAAGLCQTPEEKNLEVLLNSRPAEIITKTVPEALLLLEKNDFYFDFLLKIQLTDKIEPWEFDKLIQKLSFSHFYKQISLELGPYFTNSKAETLITALQDMNSLEYVAIYLGENPNIDENTITYISQLINNSICFALKEFHFELSSSKIQNGSDTIKALFNRESIEKLVLKLPKNNLSDEEIDQIIKLIEKKNLKFIELDLENNGGNIQTAEHLIKTIQESKSLQKANINLKNNKFNHGDIKAIKAAVEKKKDIFTIEL